MNSSPRTAQRASQYYRVCDDVSGFLIAVCLLFGPWALGCTRDWAVRTMNGFEFALGVLLLLKWIIRWRMGYAPARWNYRLPGRISQGNSLTDITAGLPTSGQKWLTRLLAVLTVLLVAWPFVAALNPRATFVALENRFDYTECIRWLPHSYDRLNTWSMAWRYLGLAIAFWAIRDWLLGKTLEERRKEVESLSVEVDEDLPPSAATGSSSRSTGAGTRISTTAIPARLLRVLWVLSISVGVLSVVSILQRLSGTDKLLWLVKPLWNDKTGIFGPFAYRGNASQYFNLAWPLILGFWWSLRAQHHNKFKRSPRSRSGGGAHIFVALLAVLAAIAPTLSAARLGAIASYIGIAGVLVGIARSRTGANLKTIAVIAVIGMGLIGGGIYIAKESVQSRFKSIKSIQEKNTLEERLDQYERTLDIIHDYQPLGTGPGSYAALYYCYLRPSDVWYPMAHNDYLQLACEWGWFGTALVGIGLTVALGLSGLSRSQNRTLANSAFVALAITLLTALGDFPFQIHSIQFLFLAVLAIAVSLPAKPEMA